MTNNDNYDAASVVGALAGLASDGDPPALVPPSALVARFCDQSAEGYAGWHGLIPSPKHEAMHARGFCGLTVIGAHDRMVSGFDDGYDFMGYLSERGWRPLPSKGDWPYVVWLRWPAGQADESETLIQYVEADLSVWQFDAPKAARRFHATIPAAP